MQSIFWHDYETFGADPQKDRPSQFAGIRTDLDLNIIEDPVTFYCRPTEDFLPSPEACLVTGITPQIAEKNGLPEVEFAERINKIFSVPGTCVAGYNSIRFDDEISRNLFYRNFIDPYAREWKNGNSRWDLIDALRLCYALKPEGINWPVENGQVSFRLEKLTEANGIDHTEAHDAMSDVYATIEMAKRLKKSQPNLFDYAFSLRDKRRVADMLDTKNLKPLIHVSSKYPASNGCCALIAPLMQHPENKNGFIAFDLRQDPQKWLSTDPDEIRRLLYTPAAELKDYESRPALKTVHVNKCPMLVPASSIKLIPLERRAEWDLDLDQMNGHLQYLRKNPEFFKRLAEVFKSDGSKVSSDDPDLMIYSGGFFSPSDRAEMDRIRSASAIELAEREFRFQDTRLPEMLFRFKARNYPEVLTDDEQEEWVKHCSKRLFGDGSEFLNLKQFGERIQKLECSDSVSKKNLAILHDLKLYAESIIPYC